MFDAARAMVLAIAGIALVVWVLVLLRGKRHHRARAILFGAAILHTMLFTATTMLITAKRWPVGLLGARELNLWSLAVRAQMLLSVLVLGIEHWADRERGPRV